MKFKNLILSACVVAANAGGGIPARAATYTCNSLTMSYCSGSATMAPHNCASGTQVCYQQEDSAGHITVPKIYTSCSTCPTGYTLTTTSVDVCSNVSNPPTIKKCCAPCSNCTSDTTWSSYDATREVKVTRSCDCGTCKATNSYRCKAGYYGSGSSSSNCTLCPADGAAGGGSTAGSSLITKCFVNSGSDTTGNYDYTEPCYYKNDSLVINPIDPIGPIESGDLILP